jgi:hypothetical protein
MALISCTDCEAKISDKADNCPHCGCPVVESLPVTEFKVELLVDGTLRFNRGHTESAQYCIEKGNSPKISAGLVASAVANASTVQFQGSAFKYNWAYVWITIVDSKPGRESIGTVTTDQNLYANKLMKDVVSPIIG